MQFNLFAEDPIVAVSISPMPWTSFFDRQRDVQVPVTPSLDRTMDDGDGEIYEDSLMLWKNEEWGAVPEVQKGKKEERSPWAGKNPIMALRVGQKSLTGKRIWRVLASLC